VKFIKNIISKFNLYTIALYFECRINKNALLQTDYSTKILIEHLHTVPFPKINIFFIFHNNVLEKLFVYKRCRLKVRFHLNGCCKTVRNGIGFTKQERISWFLRGFYLKTMKL